MIKPLPADPGTAEELKRITDNLYVDGLEAHLPFNKRRHLGGIADPIGHAQERLVKLLALERLNSQREILKSIELAYRDEAVIFTEKYTCSINAYIAELDKQIKELDRG